MLSMFFRRGLMALLVVIAALALAHPLLAQSNGAADGEQATETDGTPAARLADILEDDEARAELIRELRREAEGAEAGQAEAAPAGSAASEVMSLPRRVAGMTQSIAEGLVDEFRNLAGLVSGLDVGDAGAGLSDLAPAALQLLLVIAVTVGVFVALRRLARPLFGWISGWVAPGGGQHTGILRRSAGVLAGAVVDIVVIVLAWVAGYALALFVLGDASAMDTRHALFVNAFLVIEAFKALLRVVFASRDEALRLLPMASEEARYWNTWLARLAGLIGYGLMVVVPIVNSDVSAALGRVVAVVIMVSVFLYALVVILKNRQRVRENIGARARAAKNGLIGAALKGIARIWHLVAIVYFAALSMATLVRPQDALPFMAQATVQMLLAVGGGLFVSVLLAQMIGRRIRVPEETRQRYPSLEDRLNAFVPTGLRIVHALIVAVVVGLVLDAWALFDFRAWLVSDAGVATIATLVSVTFIVTIAGAFWIGVASWIEHRLTPEARGSEPGAREKTLLTIFRNAFAIVLVTLTAMIVLSEIGINIGPLLAGAGVLGLAIGFGSQKLVQDVITGVFLQLENAMNAGDFVTAGGLSGTVERLTIRSLGLRDLSGTYHLVPFSSVDTLSNYMRDYSYHLGDYQVAYREDTDTVVARLQDAFAELLEDDEQRGYILDDLEIFGVNELGDSGVTVRVRIKTLPGLQWAVGRAYNRLVKQHLDASGIEIPFPHMTLYFGEGRDGTAPPARVSMLDQPRAAESDATPPGGTQPAGETGTQPGVGHDEGN